MGLLQMLVWKELPTYTLSNGFSWRPGDILGRRKFTSPIEHRFLAGFDGEIAHTPGPSEVFQLSTIDQVLKDGGFLRVINPSPSLAETHRRFSRAEMIMGVSWWNMTCHATVDFIACPQQIGDFFENLRVV